MKIPSGTFLALSKGRNPSPFVLGSQLFTIEDSDCGDT
jgi:hypothetical protein